MRYALTEDEARECSSRAISTKLETFLMHRPQQLSLSLIPSVEAKSFGHVTPSRPNVRTSDSLIPLQTQMYINSSFGLYLYLFNTILITIFNI